MRQLVTDIFEVLALLTLAAAAAFAAVGSYNTAIGFAAGGGALLGESAVLQVLARPRSTSTEAT